MDGPRHRRLRVGLLAGDGTDLGRRFLAGTLLLRTRYPLWEFLPCTADRPGADHLASQSVDAILCRRAALTHALRLQVPVVVIGAGPPSVPAVSHDDLATGRLAAHHLLERGYERLVLAHYQLPGVMWRHRCAGFREVAGRRLVGEWSGLNSEHFTEALRTCPLPLGVFAVNDVLAARIAVQAHRQAIEIPGQLGLMGVDDDALHCEILSPIPLTSIAQDVEGLLERAAAMLEDLLRGGRPERVILPPLRLVVRASTAPSGDQGELPRALAIIQRHACHGLTVVELARLVGLSVRSLHRCFRKAQGRGPLEAIREVRVTEAEILLRQGVQVEEVARRVGFSSARGLSLAFREFRGMSPSAWRDQDRQRRS